MEQIQVTLTVCFEQPFWIGVCECVSKEGIQAKKVIFGAEPQMQEILQMVQKRWYQNIQFGKCISIAKKEVIHKNPKRIQRQIKKQTKLCGVGTKKYQETEKQSRQRSRTKTKISEKTTKEKRETSWTLKKGRKMI